MDDPIPYIIVDNQKIAPIERIVPGPRLLEDRHPDAGPPFGVVDRVTISNEARIRYRQLIERSAENDDNPLPLTPE